MEHPKSRVMIVDDHADAREALRSVLANEGYEIFEASSGAEVLATARHIVPDVILLDVMMPGMDGNEVCRAIRRDTELSEIPVVMVTALNDRDARLSATWSGADDFLTKPIDREEVRARVRTVTRLNRYRRLLLERQRVQLLIDRAPDGIILTDESGFVAVANPEIYKMLGLNPERTRLEGTSIWELFEGAPHGVPKRSLIPLFSRPESRAVFETHMHRRGTHDPFPVEVSAVGFPMEAGTGLQLDVRDVTERQQQLHTIRELNEKLLIAYDATLKGWVAALDLRHKETEGHTQRVTELSCAVGTAYGLPREELAHLRRGALLHDIGKLGVPDAILLKPGPLTDEEWVVMRKHPVYAYEWLHPIEFLQDALAIPRSHHERWNGSGYPDGLAGEEIPLAARIFAMVDVWDALRSDRTYRKALPAENVIEMMRKDSGKHFDPELIPLFFGVVENTHNGTKVTA
jgi:PAS domain S-box-containing protein